ncbi:MAG: hypothetical protein ACOYUZ_01175 [Patescibacteria group bacterium]
MSARYILKSDYAKALILLIEECMEEALIDQRPGVVSAICYRIELHLDKVREEASAKGDDVQADCAIMLYDMIRYQNVERFNVRQWAAFKDVVMHWHRMSSVMTESNIAEYKSQLLATGLEIHSRDSWINEIDAEIEK